MQQNKNNTLQEVRKAYRLLFQYQTRVLDLIDFIGSSFNYEYNGGFPKFSNSSPNKGKGNLNAWAWDWLNMYFYEFSFTHKEDKIKFSIFLVNDTGYFKKVKKNRENKENLISKTKISAFENIEESETKLIFVIGKNTWKPWGNDWHDDEFILNEQGNKVLRDEVMLFKSYLLEDFFDEADAIEKLRDFQIYCNGFGVEFKYQERKIK